MTQTDPKAPRADREEFQGASGDTMNSPKRLARIAGVLYLLVGIFGGFAEGFLEPRMYVAGDAANTVRNLFANS